MFMSHIEPWSVAVNVKGTYEGKVFDERNAVEFTVGDAVEQSLPEGLDVAIKKFKKGETSVLVLSPKYAFGAAGLGELELPADGRVKYEVELVMSVVVWNIGIIGIIAAAG